MTRRASRNLMLVAVLCAWFPAGPRSGQHIELAVRCDPPSARPGGWVDVVVEVRIDPTWHITSPASKSGQRAVVAFALPAGFVVAGRLRVPPGRELHDDVFGAIEILEGRFELRQRVRIPSDQPAGELVLEGSSSWVVCDPIACLPAQELAFRAPLVLGPDGEHGPNPPIGEAKLLLTTEELAGLVADGFVARARPELEPVPPGEELLVALDLAFDPTRFERVIDASIQESSECRQLGNGWRVREVAPASESEPRYRGCRLLLPLRIDERASRATLEVAIDLKLDPAEAGATLPVVRSTRLALRIER